MATADTDLMLTDGQLGRFWAKVRPRDDLFSCWEWQGARNDNGYGLITNLNKCWRLKGHGAFARAHRVSYEINVGPIPEGMFVCHRCDNPACVRPDHLFVGTVQDNNADCRGKGRNNFGERNGQAKLDRRKVREIKKRVARGDILREIATDYGVARTTVSDIKHERTWY